MRGLVREVRGVEAGAEVVVTFTAGAVVSGVEVVAEGW
jgi:hypothetical protein